MAVTFHSRADDAAETCRLIEAENEHAPLCVQGSVTDAAHARDTVSALGRVGTADEAARAITWVALENRYMNGAVIALSGGL
jgi:NAD(P)-dependent dehydrogenase (short-subunit alcohol dehydrogenase family)